MEVRSNSNVASFEGASLPSGMRERGVPELSDVLQRLQIGSSGFSSDYVNPVTSPLYLHFDKGMSENELLGRLADQLEVLPGYRRYLRNKIQESALAEGKDVKRLAKFLLKHAPEEAYKNLKAHVKHLRMALIDSSSEASTYDKLRIVVNDMVQIVSGVRDLTPEDASRVMDVLEATVRTRFPDFSLKKSA